MTESSSAIFSLSRLLFPRKRKEKGEEKKGRNRWWLSPRQTGAFPNALVAVLVPVCSRTSSAVIFN
jgi:hypothetical protein